MLEYPADNEGAPLLRIIGRKNGGKEELYASGDSVWVPVARLEAVASSNKLQLWPKPQASCTHSSYLLWAKPHASARSLVGSCHQK